MITSKQGLNYWKRNNELGERWQLTRRISYRYRIGFKDFILHQNYAKYIFRYFMMNPDVVRAKGPIPSGTLL